MGLRDVANVDLHSQYQIGLLTRVICLVNAVRLRWLAGYGCVVGVAKYWFDSSDFL